MAIIPCGDNCIYQIDGYCHLELPSVVTNNTMGSCVYRVCPDESLNSGADCIKSFTNSTNTNNLNIQIL